MGTPVHTPLTTQATTTIDQEAKLQAVVDRLFQGTLVPLFGAGVSFESTLPSSWGNKKWHVVRTLIEEMDQEIAKTVSRLSPTLQIYATKISVAAKDATSLGEMCELYHDLATIDAPASRRGQSTRTEATLVRQWCKFS